jgi:ubiquinone/menaquinone biosynthesis C-methylase UbiE
MTEELIHKPVDFSRQYFLLRKKEGRIYSDEEVAALPEIDKQHRYYREWQIRKNSSAELIKYLGNKKRPLQILEIGCGNGWLSAKLSLISSSRVTGIDINTEELNQANRVFRHIKNLIFFERSLQDEVISNLRFDIIIFAASIQYFSLLQNILNEAISCLKPGGEVHIIDSHFYNQKDVNDARQRSKEYYNAIGFPEMARQYFHHSFEELRLFRHKMLYKPGSIINRFKKNKSPFHWICIKANA